MDPCTTDTKTLLKQLTAQYYDDLNHAHERGQKVVWTNGLFPQEFFEAMDIQVAYPENLAATLGAKKGVMPYLEKCEALGYSSDLCSYTRIGLGYIESFDSDILNLPRPDMICNCTNICGLCVKWFECTAKRLDVPYILIDTPYQTEYGPTENDVDYIVSQFQELIRQLELLYGRPFNYKKFRQVLAISRRVAKSWKRATDYVQHSPSPLDGFNLFNYMFLAVVARGKSSTADFYDRLSEEMEEYLREHKSQFKGEQKHRIMWEGIACWPHLAQNYKCLKANDMIVVGGMYPVEWCVDYDQDDVRSLARAYAARPPIGSLTRQTDIRARIMEETRCDGALYHVNRSCKILTFLQAGLRRGIYERNHKPFATFDGDQTDPTTFSPAQFETRVQALRENMEAAKAERGGP